MLDAVELKCRSFSCLFSSGQHGGQRKPADVIINGQLGGTKTAKAASKVIYDGFLCVSLVHVDQGRGLLGTSVRHYYRYDGQ